MTAAEINTLVSNMSAQNVSVIEADSVLSDYLTDAQFTQELTVMRDLASAAHAKGIKVVWYYPGLEVLTANGQTSGNSMYKDHPNWVQIGLNGTENVFYGGLVFWVEPGMESAWMAPSNAEYRTYFTNRVMAIAGTGVDGLWIDVPLLNDIGVDWADTSAASKNKFLAETSLLTPSAVNWSAVSQTTPALKLTCNALCETWHKWINWRHHEITDFLIAVRDAGNSVNPNFKLIVETVTMDYTAPTKIGLEGPDLKDMPGATQVWELDAISDTNAMRKAKEDDWISLIAMNKFARGASGQNPSWIFTYGKQANDAELVMAEAIAAGNNPYETKIPEMTTTVGAAYRTKMFGWIKANEPYIYGTRKGARVAVLYSPPSRDYVDQAKGTGLYVTTTSGATEWWSTDAVDSAYSMQYLAEYRGMVKLLVHNHIPFDVIVKPSATELASYQTVIMPDVEALSDEDAALLREYVSAGGHLIATGPNPGGWDEFGLDRDRVDYALSTVFGITKASALPTSKIQGYGSGEARSFSGLLGKKYFTNAADAASAASSLLGAINATSTSWLTTNANKKVHIELSQTDSKLLLHYVNFIGVTGTFAVTPTTASTTVKIPAGKEVTAVELTSPDNATAALSPLAYTPAGQDVSFSVPVTEYALVVVSLKGSGPVANQPPVANPDSLSATQGTPVDFTAPQLLANDTDPNGDNLTLTGISTTTSKGGNITGTYIYTPAAGFAGTDTFTYQISDGKGGTATGTVNVTVTALPQNHPPVASADSLTTTQGTAVNFTASQLLANDTDQDVGDVLGVTSVAATSTKAVAIVNHGSGSYTYSAPGFTGTDSFTYQISDGKGGVATGTVNVTVNTGGGGITPAKYFPQGVTLLTGTFDSGTVTSFTASDGNTYDIKSAYVAADSGGATDWYAKATITGTVSAVTQLTVTYTGQFSKTSVTQRFYLYNFGSGVWDLFDTRSVGNTNDVTVTAVVATNPQRYISPNGELRARVKGVRAGSQSTTAVSFFSWANYLSWDIK